ncbi:DUF2863 family protein [Massilia glaciei]|uniref:DUF2863 domain-containing protein n=1 Tax=Massilia glaciei TaxID=1524097 RepID=A0A2U2HNS4_9BURK|nr:DUF2863 family protein [Massilia glaciei]PWF49161.1 DUF2863 domain-containing protein [Massilia glaciei]
MPKNKRPEPRKPAKAAEPDDDTLAQALADLALELAEQEDFDAAPELAREQGERFNRIVRNALRKNNDELLYGAVERARYADVGAYQYLRSHIEEASATALMRREGGPPMEINAFAVPVFVHSTGGLKQAEGFQDPDAFDALVASFAQAGLESPDAKVVLISHAYDLDEIDRITYSHLSEMVRDAHATMTEKKLTATPALERSLAGWSESGFGAGDQAMELRFLLGFALKRTDDPFYQVPNDEAEADAWFAARMLRYQAWTGRAAPLVKRCMAGAPASLELNFLYQDLFFGAKEQGVAEYAMLQMMAAVNQALERHQCAPGAVRAVVAPADVDDVIVLRVNLYANAGGALLVSSEKPFDLAADLETEVDDIADALGTLGIVAVEVAMKFDKQGTPVDPRPCHGA